MQLKHQRGQDDDALIVCSLSKFFGVVLRERALWYGLWRRNLMFVVIFRKNGKKKKERFDGVFPGSIS